MSDRTVYAIASGKGGVGKTTTAINLGSMLADRDHEVVVVDTDLGMANLADFLDFEIGSPTLQEVLAGDARADAAIDRAPGDIDVLPSAPDIEAFTRSDPANLDGVVADLRDEYDYVLLDTGAGVSFDVLVPMALADGVLLVATPDVASVRDTAKTGELAARVDTEVVGAVLTQRSSDILTADDVEETLGTEVLAVVPEDEAVPMGIDAGRPLAAFAPNAPAGQAYRDLAGVVTGETDPDPELDLDDGGVDVAFDADPPGRDDAGESDADRPASAEAAGGVTDIAGGDESGGLLGGELAKAAEEIRAEAERAAEGTATESTGEPFADRHGGSDAHRRDESASDEHDGSETRRTDGSEAGRTNESDADQNDESDARSVDDLLDEHLGDDRTDDFGDENDDFGDESDDFGNDDSETEADDFDGDAEDFGGEAEAFGGESDDPLAGADEDPAGDTAEGARRDDAASDGVGTSEGPRAPDESRAPDEPRDDPDQADEAPAGTGVPFDDDREGRPRQGATDDADLDAPGADGPDAGADRTPDDRDDGGDDGGVLGRLGSLFR